VPRPTAALPLLVGLILVACSQGEPSSRLYIVGDGDAVGAEIYLDGSRVGVMERRIESGPGAGSSRPELEVVKAPVEVFSVGVDLRVARGERPRTYGVYDQVRAWPGNHELAFVHTDGRRLVKRIEVKNEAYIAVSFGERRIQGGE
jgi:hypothetical protein